jgi:hypothetical protein
VILGEVDWPAAARDVVEHGWARLASVLSPDTCDRLRDAAPDSWVEEPEQIGEVSQRGLTSGAVADACSREVQGLGEEIVESLNRVLDPGTSPIPTFNTVTWGRTLDGRSFISRHRDPRTAGGVIATVTLSGTATFRIWGDDEAAEWNTADGDVVIVRGTGWPTQASICPLHEAESVSTERFTLTFRHNLRGAGESYF